MDRVALSVGQYLDFHVPWILQKLLHVDLIVIERGFRFRFRHRHRVAQVRFRVHDAHAAPAAAARRFDDDGIADLARDAAVFDRIVAERSTGTRHARHAGRFHRLDGRNFVAHQTDHVGGRADEDESGLLDALGEIGIFRKKTVAGMDRLRVRHFRCGNDRRHVEITFRRRRGTDANGFVGHADMFQIAVDRGMHRNGFDAQRVARAQYSQRDFAAVGDNDFIEHRHLADHK